FDLCVSELEHLAVGERVVLETDTAALGQVGRRAGAAYELWQTRDVVRLDMRVEHCDDRHSLRVGQPDVLVDEVDVRLDDLKLAVGVATEQIGRARALVVQKLSEVHVVTSTGDWP